MSSNNPRILVGCPTASVKNGSIHAYMNGLTALTYPQFDVVIEDNSLTTDYAQLIQKLGEKFREKKPGCEFRVIHSGHVSPNVKERIVHGRNKIREIVLNEKYDYFFSLEQDVICPRDTIERLLAHHKEVVGGIYCNPVLENGREVVKPLLVVYPNEEKKKEGLAVWARFTDLFPSRLVEVAMIGLGCTLISRSTLEKIFFRIVEGKPAFDDVQFSIDLHRENIPWYADTSILCEHLYNQAFKSMPTTNKEAGEKK